MYNLVGFYKVKEEKIIVKMKKFWLMGVILVALVAVLLVGCSSPNGGGTVTGLISSQQEGIVVTGTGKVTVTPDIADVILGVNVREATVADAQAKAAEAMSQIMAVLKQNNIADKDIKTQQFNISPVYSYDSKDNTSVIIGYEVTNTVHAKIRNLTNVGTIIDAAAQAGGDLTRVNSISFSVEDPTKYYSDARELAMNDAKDTAKQLASLGGVTLGKPTYISQSSYYPQTINYYKDSAVGAASAPSTPISPGETDITLTVQVTYSIIK
jgi:uncharacterized protein YggE